MLGTSIGGYSQDISENWQGKVQVLFLANFCPLLIENIIDNLPAKDKTEERENKDNYYITGTAVFTEYKGHLYN